jgi:hypothetical protein
MRVADLFPETLIPAAAKANATVAMTATVAAPVLHRISFRNTRLVCIEQGEEILVAMRPVVDGMGLAWQVQHRKLMDDAERWSVTMMVTVAEDGKQREMLCIPIERLFGWLMTIHPSRVNPAIRDTVIAYQRECDKVLFRHFVHDLHLESAALRTLRPVTVEVARLTLEGKTRAEIAGLLGKSVAAITYHRRSARRLGLLPQRAA